MKQYDHEPSVSELLDQFQKEDMYIPPFMPDIKIPIIKGIVNKKLKEGLRDTYVNLIIM